MSNCTLALDYSREITRLCASYSAFGLCSTECPFFKEFQNEKSCAYGQITQEHIDLLQKWSDENPPPHQKTYAEDFFDKFPDADICPDGSPAVCRVRCYGGECRSEKTYPDSSHCKECWFEPIPEHIGRLLEKKTKPIKKTEE